MFAGVVGLTGLLVIWFLSSGAKEQNPFAASSSEMKRNKLKLHCVKVTAIALAITGVVHIVFCGIAVENHNFAKGITFDNYEDFVKFMETPMNAYDYWDEDGMNHVEIYESQVTIPGDSIDDIKNEAVQSQGTGNQDSIITDEDKSWQEENVHKEQLCDRDGNVLCEYYERNKSVAITSYGEEENGYLPITVYTRSELSFAAHIMNDVVTPLCVLIYVVEVLIGIRLYFKKRRLV